MDPTKEAGNEGFAAPPPAQKFPAIAGGQILPPATSPFLTDAFSVSLKRFRPVCLQPFRHCRLGLRRPAADLQAGHKEPAAGGEGTRRQLSSYQCAGKDWFPRQVHSSTPICCTWLFSRLPTLRRTLAGIRSVRRLIAADRAATPASFTARMQASEPDAEYQAGKPAAG